jgi:hypothetical protein
MIALSTISMTAIEAVSEASAIGTTTAIVKKRTPMATTSTSNKHGCSATKEQTADPRAPHRGPGARRGGNGRGRPRLHRRADPHLGDQAALDKVALGLLDDHARYCVVDGRAEGSPDELTDELMAAVGRLMRRG